VTDTADEARRNGRWDCPACGLALRPDDAVVVVTLRPFHAACAEASFADREGWEHTDVVTLSQWSRGIGWGSSA
jgi:hypothetical protein